MAIESISKRDDSTDPSNVCDSRESTSAAGAPPNASSSSSAASAASPPNSSSDPAVQSLADKFTPGPAWRNLPVAKQPPSNFDGCGEVQDCADLDGRPVRAGQTTSDANVSFSVTARRFAPFETFGGKFEGDAKSRGIPASKEGTGGFTTDPNATSRTMMRVQVDQGVITQPLGHADVSRHPVLGEARAHVRIKDHSVAASSVDGVINTKASGANPLVPVSPDNDSDLQVAYEMSPGKLHLQGTLWGDRFPNGELMISDRAGSTLMLGEFQTEHGAVLGLRKLLGDSARVPELELLELEADIPLDPDGNFAGSPAVRAK